MSKINRFWLIPIICVIFIGCNTNYEHIIPDTYVNFTIRLQDPDYWELNTPGSSVMVKGGYNGNGIIIYRLTQTEFLAYDRTCTFNVEQSCSVLLDKDNPIVVECPCCGSVYELGSGSPTKSPATYGLKQYKTYYNQSSGILTVSN